jgi:hypothetical protein
MGQPRFCSGQRGLAVIAVRGVILYTQSAFAGDPSLRLKSGYARGDRAATLQVRPGLAQMRQVQERDYAVGGADGEDAAIRAEGSGFGRRVAGDFD